MKRNKFTLSIFFLSLCISFLLTGCGQKSEVSSESISAISEEAKRAEENEEREQAERERHKKLAEGNVELSKYQIPTYGNVTGCCFQSDKQHVTLDLEIPDIPQSDDAFIYLFAFETYDSEHNMNTVPITSSEKATTCHLTWEYQEEQLFQEFVPALLVGGEYIPLSTGSYITNPEIIADNQDSIPLINSKKGLLIDPSTLETPLLEDLGVKHAIYNIPLSMILGETTNTACPTIYYDFRGKTYQFNGAAINGYDYLFSYLTSLDMISTAIVLNDWDENNPQLIHPKSRNQDAGAYYYAFNTAEKEGCEYLEAIASFLTERYNGGEYGLVSNWIIANEINQQTTWNYMDTDDVDYYAQEFEKSLRIFNNAAKSNYANAKVYFSLDHDWNNNKGNNSKHFNGKDLLTAINRAAAQKGNYNWGLAIHPYPNPLTRVNYWKVDYDKSIDAPLLTLMNLNVVTDLLKQKEYLDQNGNVRTITVTELGFTSSSGEKLQAAAFAYCYYIIEANPYIESFIMNRQTDAPEEMKQGLAFGIYTPDYSPKYIYDVFKYIDTNKASEYTDFMLNILGADSIEEALEWAQ